MSSAKPVITSHYGVYQSKYVS